MESDLLVVMALLDEKHRALLLAMGHELRSVVVGGGVVDVAWHRFHVDGTHIASAGALAVAHVIASRLYAA